MGRRLTLAVPSLHGGGAERVLAQMANHWAARGDSVTVITLSGSAGDAYPLDPRVTRIALNLMHDSRGIADAVTKNIVRIQRLREAIARTNPDTVISFTDRMNVLTALACRPLGIDAVLSERIDPSHQKIGRAWAWLRRRAYPAARALVVQTERVRQQMAGVMRGRPIYVIPNAVGPSAKRESEEPDPDRTRWIVGMGRLDPQKGFDLLIDAFSKIADQHPRWSLTILGEGPQRAALEHQIENQELSDRVILQGWESNPAAVLQRSDLFVLSSRYEGFPNALLEAMACGVAVISFDCECGPREIIRDGIDGLLAPPEDVDALAAAMHRILSDAALRDRLGRESPHVTERFSIDRYFANWEGVLQKQPPQAEDRHR
jgi:glycosyltransferase involved in cell wall biosynthesis